LINTYFTRINPVFYIYQLDTLIEEAITQVHPEIRDGAAITVRKISYVVKTIEARDLVEICDKYIREAESGDRVAEKKRLQLIFILLISV
jgi:hypothetical protein